jgi:hypothetical protein
VRGSCLPQREFLPLTPTLSPASARRGRGGEFGWDGGPVSNRQFIVRSGAGPEANGPGQLMIARIALFGLAMGLVSAGLLASAGLGDPAPSLPLFFAAPFPLYLAGMMAPDGTRGLAAVLAGTAAAAILSVSAGGAWATFFALVDVAPATALCGLAGTTPGRGPAGLLAASSTPGRMVIAACLIAGSLGAFALYLAGAADQHTFALAIRTFVTDALQRQMGTVSPGLGQGEIDTLTETIATLLPLAAPLPWLGAMLGNAWVAGRIAHAMGRLRRPWPDIPAMTYPAGAPGLFALAIGLSLLPGFPGLAARAFAGALLVAYVLLGLAILHSVTRGTMGRPVVLAGVYAGLVVLTLVAWLLLALLGLADGLRPLRRAPPPGST